MKGVLKLEGKRPGKTLAIFCGVHGNEKVGVKAINKVKQDLKINNGTVYLVFANPTAIKINKRVYKKNLNRLFYKGNKGGSYEDDRAKELMKILNKCDALLDIHSYNSPTGNQFAICEKNAHKIVQKMDFPIVVSGFSKIGHGTEGYMYKLGKIGICIECGTSNRSNKFLPLAIKSIYQFLQFFNSIDTKVKFDNVVQKKIAAKRIIYKNSDNFKFAKKYKDFEKLIPNKPYIFDGDKIVKAKPGECIIFPRANVPTGGEVCVIGKVL